MPFPLFFIAPALVAGGGFGSFKTVKAVKDSFDANNLNKTANEIIENAADLLEAEKESCTDALESIGELKLSILNGSLREFTDSFSKLKNVDFRETSVLENLKDIPIDKKEFDEMKSMVSFAGNLAAGAAAGTASGLLTAFGAYSSAQVFASASTGTAINTLAGIAAKNATLAFFGGGSLAAGGLGMAGGAVVLGSMVAVPALAVMGMVAGAAADKELEKAKTNHAEAVQIANEINKASLECEAIRRRTASIYNLLARLDARLLPLVYEMEDIIRSEGTGYQNFTEQSKNVVASCCSLAVTVKKVIDTPILNEDGSLSLQSESVETNLDNYFTD